MNTFTHVSDTLLHVEDTHICEKYMDFQKERM